MLLLSPDKILDFGHVDWAISQEESSFFPQSFTLLPCTQDCECFVPFRIVGTDKVRVWIADRTPLEQPYYSRSWLYR